MENLKQKILEFCKQRQYISFVELLDNIPEMKGDRELAYSSDRGVFVMWCGMTEEAAELLHKMSKADEIHFLPSSALVYMIDGGMLTLPIPKRRPPIGGKKEWWTPVTINLGPLPQKIKKKLRYVA